MFDKYTISPATGSVYHTHTERRAPTEESVKLLREMESVAKNEVEKTIRLEFNGIKTVAKFYREPFNDQDRVVFYMNINGNDIKEDIILERYEDGEARAGKIIKALSDRLASELFRNSFNAIRDAFGILK